MIESFNLDQIQPLEPILSLYFSHFFTFIMGPLWGAQSYYPKRANNGKMELPQVQNWMRQSVLSAWGIQAGPFAACWAPFVLLIFQIFHFHTGEPILITPEG